ncbi:MAG: short-subunit dehydrogenase [Bacteroidia bacterium]|jgi:short-subunit dehydrogenase
MQNLVEKYGGWALVTGGSQGIGKGFARRLAQEGFNIVLTARRDEILQAAAAELRDEFSVETRTLALDMTLEGAIENIQAFVADLEIGFLVNNVAFSKPAPFLDLSERNLRKQIYVNVETVAMLTSHFGRMMRERDRGAIINVSSRTGELAMPYFAMYCATKSFINLLTESLWFEMKDTNVDVVVVKPDQTATEGYLAKNPTIWGDAGIQSVEDCVEESMSALGKYAGWLTWPKSRDDVKALRDMPLEEAIAVNGAGMLSVFSEQLDSKS